MKIPSHFLSLSLSACTQSRECGGAESTCDSSLMDTVDAIILLGMLAALGFLLVPYTKLLLEFGVLLHPACVSATIFFDAAVIATFVV
ncbi:hypothetical protein PR202_gb25412 [Eleusine coracana subsp. coracana]|uniref:Uncharacterized protein n=1 Tax=Eleusine coracana subsp. coracana TaxID=191504 RepID=A0AAV5FQI4_ELECO|nr:hypothetical protein PR202_gb25412 [Eleusine coracana subsp. coracana]